MAYTILTLMYRAGLSSTEITELNGEEDFCPVRCRSICIPARERRGALLYTGRCVGDPEGIYGGKRAPSQPLLQPQREEAERNVYQPYDEEVLRGGGDQKLQRRGGEELLCL